MTKSIWMNAWDLEDRDPRETIDLLQSLGLNACNLGFAYHGGRMLLPGGKRRVVYTQHDSAVYFQTNPSRYGRLQPQVAPEAAPVAEFTAACERRKFPVNAWTVLCHNDQLGKAASDCCIQNVFGDAYPYALCPSNPEVRRYIVTLCAEIAELPGVASLDLEALSFMGYEHQSLHDKRGVTLSPEVIWLLSICLCRYCCAGMGGAAEEIRHKAKTSIRNFFSNPTSAGDLEEILGDRALVALLRMRRRALLELLKDIRGATGAQPLNVRIADSTLDYGGKAQLTLPDLTAAADAATRTFFGMSVDRMRSAVQKLPSPGERDLPLHAGFVFHEPDCVFEKDVRARLEMLRQAGLDGVHFYSFSLAASRHFDWLRRAITGVFG